jgi:hypothetical protein
MIKIIIPERDIKEKQYVDAMLKPLIIRIGYLKLSLKHLLEDSTEIHNNGIESYKSVTRKIICLIEGVRKYGKNEDFNAPKYLSTIDTYLRGPNKFQNFKIRELLDYLIELEQDDAKLLKALLSCPADELFDLDASVKSKFNEVEIKILSFAINYGYKELSKVAKNFFRTHNFVHSCPYCNLENAKYKKGKRRSALGHVLDHFFCQADFPSLSLSMYNLVPCGTQCNGTDNKGEIPFSKEFHLNPYIDGFNGMVRFYPIKVGREVIAVEATPDCDPSGVPYKRILGDYKDKTSEEGLKKGNINVFELETKYSDRLDEAQDVLDIMNKSVTGLRSISLFLGQMVGLDADKAYKKWYKGEMKTYFEPEYFHKKDLSKFKRDIHDFYVLNDSIIKISFIRNLINY